MLLLHPSINSSCEASFWVSRIREGDSHCRDPAGGASPPTVHPRQDLHR